MEGREGEEGDWDDKGDGGGDRDWGEVSKDMDGGILEGIVRDGVD